MTKEYSQAAKEMQNKLNDYLRRFATKDKIWQQWVADGTKTQAEYDEWRVGQICMGQRWQEMRDTLAEDMHNTNKIAKSIMNGYNAEAYALNHNYGTYECEKGAMVDTSYTLYDRDTVENMMREDPEMLPPPGKKVSERIREGKDIRWNKQVVQSVALQSVLQGESISDIASRLALAVADSNRKAAIRNARTLMTGAENAGRVDSYKRAQKMGIDLVQQWMATLDGRTRHSHRQMDGVTVDVGKKFPNGCRFPGDPEAPAREVYNCFVGDVNVATDSDIVRSYKHKYDGKLVTIKTSMGVEFTCTPNHPILTMRGWISAERLNEGDNILIASRSNFKFARRNPNVYHGFARFDTVHEFVNMLGSKRTRRLGVNFHGDIPTSNVEIVTQKRFLGNNRNVGKLEKKGKLRFKDSDAFAFRNCHAIKSFGRIWKTSFSNISRMCKTFSFRFGCLSHAKVHGFRPIAWLDSCGVKPLFNDISGNVEFLRECLDGFSGIVFADDIVSINVDSRCTHVYNLQTVNGYYFVNNSITCGKQMFNGVGAIAHNCRCTLVADIKGFEDDFSDLSWRKDDKLGGMSYEEWKKGHGKSEPIDKPDKVSQKAKQIEIANYKSRNKPQEKKPTTKVVKRKQLDTGYKGKVPDAELDKFNANALQQIIKDTGYSESEAKRLQNAFQHYFGGDWEQILKGNDDTEIIKAGLQKMPSYDGKIYRGLIFYDDEIERFTKLKKGDIIPKKGSLESWTSDERAANSFAGINSYERSSVILECMDNESGKGVQHLSKFGTREAEVLSADAEYEVVGIEIESKYDFLAKHPDYLYFPDDLEEDGGEMRRNTVCRIKVKEKR